MINKTEYINSLETCTTNFLKNKFTSNINNVKTLSYVPWIIDNGSKEFKNIGTESSPGTAIVCLSGHIKNRGMYEIPFGMSLGDLLHNVGGGSSTDKEIKYMKRFLEEHI